MLAQGQASSAKRGRLAVVSSGPIFLQKKTERKGHYNCYHSTCALSFELHKFSKDYYCLPFQPTILCVDLYLYGSIYISLCVCVCVCAYLPFIQKVEWCILSISSSLVHAMPPSWFISSPSVLTYTLIAHPPMVSTLMNMTDNHVRVYVKCMLFYMLLIYRDAITL